MLPCSDLHAPSTFRTETVSECAWRLLRFFCEKVTTMMPDGRLRSVSPRRERIHPRSHPTTLWRQREFFSPCTTEISPKLTTIKLASREEINAPLQYGCRTHLSRKTNLT